MGMEAVAATGGVEAQKKNRIQVSNTKKPLFFYVNLAKRYIQQHDEVELSALGMAITTVVTIAEILKNNGLAIEKKVSTSTVSMKDENKGRVVLKAKAGLYSYNLYSLLLDLVVEFILFSTCSLFQIEIVLGKSDKFDLLMNASNAAPETDTKNKE
ncbi:D NUCLDUO1-ACTIVATEEIC ACID BINDING PROTEIN 1 [Hibiscus trionum]|uniref:D NUCLDUO1-ACTIVATEEIC ACID BINDING PROTEIN 1 n=1 Tax=Hibiscus trionum TaxID=183268 RepID=A0A9W7HK67_HIBTR|nr:D NUCLDUO1-ACTIVATEEIC ACID BINDING PROTEIN 1 [Hibiscus trionum]